MKENNKYAAMVKEAPENVAETCITIIKKGFEANKTNLAFKFENETRREDYDGIVTIDDEDIQKYMTDTKIVCVLMFDNIGDEEESRGSTPITKNMLEMWEVEAADVVEVCYDNLMNEENTFNDMFNVMLQMTGSTESELRGAIGANEIDNKMFVLTNKSGYLGARMILSEDVRNEILKHVGPYYVIPSSIHELLIFPDDGNMQKEALEKIVEEVNDSQVSFKDLLSYKVAYIA